MQARFEGVIIVIQRKVLTTTTSGDEETPWLLAVKKWVWSKKSGWWYTYPSEKYEFIIPFMKRKIEFMFQTTNRKWLLAQDIEHIYPKICHFNSDVLSELWAVHNAKQWWHTMWAPQVMFVGLDSPQ